MASTFTSTVADGIADGGQEFGGLIKKINAGEVTELPEKSGFRQLDPVVKVLR